MANEGEPRRIPSRDPDLKALEEMNGAAHILDGLEDVGEKMLAKIIKLFGGHPDDPKKPGSNRHRKTAA